MDGRDAALDWLTVRAAKLCLDLQRRDQAALKLSLWLNVALTMVITGVVEFWRPMAIVYAISAIVLIWIALAIFIAVATVYSAAARGMMHR